MTDLEAALAASVADPTARTPIEAPKPTGRIGGSDIGALLGMSKYGNATDVYARVVHGISKAANRGMGRGRLVEPLLRASYAEHITALEPHVDYYESPFYEFAGGQMDDTFGAPVGPGVVDYKSISEWDPFPWGPSMSDEVPPYIDLQVRWYALISRRDVCHVYAGFGHDGADEKFGFTETRLYVLVRDAELEAAMLAAAERFWVEHILPRRWPDVAPLNNRRIIKRLRMQDPQSTKEAAHG